MGKCSNGKHSKIRITGLTLTINYWFDVDDKLLMSDIGKMKNPRCFKNNRGSSMPKLRPAFGLYLR